MAYDLDHWNNPRGSIANKYVKNDFAYVSRGASIALYVLEKFDLKPSEAKQLSILDYGCGTGRASFFLSKIFGKVIGYDPNTYCITEAYKENKKSDSDPKNLVFTSDFSQVTECDLAVSSNVIEHLDVDTAKIMVDNLIDKVKGHTLLWYSPINNTILSEYMIASEWEHRIDLANNGGRIQIDMFDFRKNILNHFH